MPLPAFNENGDLPEGVHKASLDEVIACFGHGTPQRQLVTARLKRVFDLAQRTNKLERVIIFGSYITSKSSPNDVDIILVMRDDFTSDDYAEEFKKLFENCFQPRSGNQKVARRETSGTIGNRFPALKTRKECLALLQSAKTNLTATRRFTSGYFLHAPSAQILIFQTVSKPLFNHVRAQEELGASIFAIRPSFVLLETVDEFVAHWQIKRDKTKRGIVEVIWR